MVKKKKKSPDFFEHAIAFEILLSGTFINGITNITAKPIKYP